jgi:alpha-1,2-mannosyltransferase
VDGHGHHGRTLRNVRLATLILFALAVLSVRLPYALAQNAAYQHLDFGVFYQGASCLLSGCDPYPVTDGAPPNLAPPHALALFIPLTGLSVAGAYYPWLIVSALALVWCGWRIASVLELRLSPLALGAVAAVVLSSGLTMASVTSGNYYAALTVPLTEAWVRWRRGQMVYAGAFIGLAAACKVLLLLPLLWFLIHREWKAAAMMVWVGLFITLAGIAALGPGVYLDWLRLVARAPMDGQFHHAAVLQMLHRWLSETPQFQPLIIAPDAIRPAWAVLAGLLCAMTLAVKRAPDAAVLSLLTCAVLVSPLGWILTGFWFVGPAVAIFSPQSKWLLIAAAVMLWLPDTLPVLGQPSVALTLTLGVWNTAIVALLWIAAVISFNGTRDVKENATGF